MCVQNENNFQKIINDWSVLSEGSQTIKNENLLFNIYFDGLDINLYYVTLQILAGLLNSKLNE